jgi:hypothetical protein
MPGQPSFFIVNGKYSDFYPWPTTKILSPELPQDIGPEKYHVNQPITFEIDFTKFPQVTPEQLKKTKFYWKYGDNALGNGAQNTHAYAKPGKYVLEILADDNTMPSPQLFESIELTIVPDETEAKTNSQSFSYAAIAGIILGIIVVITALVTILSRKR